MKKKTLLILVKGKPAATFLKTFFRTCDTYRPVFCNTPPSPCMPLANERDASAVIAEVSLLPSLSLLDQGIPCIAMIGGEKKKGVETAAAYTVKGYITSPFVREDLDFKLNSVIRHSEMIRAQKKEIQDLRTLHEFAQLISSTLDPKQILFMIVKRISDLMPVTRCSIIQVDWLHKFAYVVASFETPNVSMIKLSLKKYPEIVEALLRKKPIVVSDINTSPIMKSVRDIISPLGIRSILVMPIIFEKKVIGTLFLRTSRKQHTFRRDEIRLLKGIADVSANTLYNAFRFAQVEDEKTRLEKLAITDYLTGLYNVRYFQHRIIEEFTRAERYKLPICCLMLDIDRFKKINDTHGHKAGDLVLKEFAQQLRQLSRKSDVLARYGGEEFIIMLPQTTIAGAISEAERIRNAITAHAFKGLKSGTRLTVSIGISSFPHARIKTYDNLISAADDSLYEAKKSGRDRVVVFT